jgi:hypothetical protein
MKSSAQEGESPSQLIDARIEELGDWSETLSRVPLYMQRNSFERRRPPARWLPQIAPACAPRVSAANAWAGPI